MKNPRAKDALQVEQKKKYIKHKIKGLLCQDESGRE